MAYLELKTFARCRGLGLLTSFYDNLSRALVLVELLIHSFPHWAWEFEVIRLYLSGKPIPWTWPFLQSKKKQKEERKRTLSDREIVAVSASLKGHERLIVFRYYKELIALTLRLGYGIKERDGGWLTSVDAQSRN
ncbi:hypothetical protein M9H77_18933 [Catharanthus roseus]|uniref:Uncharacterized protein n=1 Tax=Catharanthus roseus TaxID=4058 RepID=A0ACC0B8U2_CATRO|nr:hypothetical protein M9H77_18933 [Catharanthus roseus]